MRITALAFIGCVCAVLSVGNASAQVAIATDRPQPAPLPQAAYAQDNFVSFTVSDAIGTSPSEQPAAGAQTPAKPADQAAEKKEEPAAPCPESSDEPEAFKLFKCPCLEEDHIDIRGWLDMGYTWNPANPANGVNGPVGYNSRANEFMGDQLYLIMERVTKVENDCGVDWGGRVDFLYGQDWRYPVTFGLDSEWNPAGQFYGLVMPQAYVDLAINKWVIRAGEFLAPCGYESVMAPENFFYSHTYGFLYGQPTTLSGGEAMYKINDQWTANIGLDTGWNNWTDQTNRLNYFGGVNWTSEDKKTTAAWETFIGNTDAFNPAATRFHYCFVLTQKIGEKWRFALENNVGYDNGAIDPVQASGGGQSTSTFHHGDWVNVATYFIYDINACWSAGLRYEWLCDDDGTIVQQLGPPAAGPYPAHFSDLTLGLNWKPNQSKNVLVRSELRWDWAADSLPSGQRPFDDGTKNEQFLWATDLIVLF